MKSIYFNMICVLSGMTVLFSRLFVHDKPLGRSLVGQMPNARQVSKSTFQHLISGALVMVFGLMFTTLQAQTETIPSGAFIVNMGITPQTDANGLKPYGMLYDLLLNYQVPIKWVINPSKGRDGEDFNHNGTSYRGGTFIIPAEFRTAAVNGVIASWQGQGVVGNTSVSAITVPVYGTIKSAPRWDINPDKPEIVTAYLTAAGIPSSAYSVTEASALGGCDDIYLIPHDDNISSANLANWNDIHKGYIWSGCKSGSVMENNVANFLSNSGLTGFGGAWGNPSVSYDFNADPPIPPCPVGAAPPKNWFISPAKSA
jgi:hypothetical protein